MPQPTVLPHSSGFGFALEPGSSISSRGSVVRLVTGAEKKTARLTCGTGFAAGVGVPPVQVMTISPTSSVLPSARTVGAEGTLALHTDGVAASAGAARIRVR